VRQGHRVRGPCLIRTPPAGPPVAACAAGQRQRGPSRPRPAAEQSWTAPEGGRRGGERGRAYRLRLHLLGGGRPVAGGWCGGRSGRGLGCAGGAAGVRVWRRAREDLEEHPREEGGRSETGGYGGPRDGSAARGAPCVRAERVGASVRASSTGRAAPRDGILTCWKSCCTRFAEKSSEVSCAFSSSRSFTCAPSGGRRQRAGERGSQNESERCTRGGGADMKKRTRVARVCWGTTCFL
jgi:hypothetical protein